MVLNNRIFNSNIVRGYIETVSVGTSGFPVGFAVGGIASSLITSIQFSDQCSGVGIIPLLTWTLVTVREDPPMAMARPGELTSWRLEKVPPMLIRSIGSGFVTPPLIP